MSTLSTVAQRLTSAEAESSGGAGRSGATSVARPPRARLRADGSLHRVAEGAGAARTLRARRPGVVGARRADGGDRPLRPGQGRELRAVRLDAHRRRTRRRAAQAGLGLALGPARRPADRARPRLLLRPHRQDADRGRARRASSAVTVDELRASLEDIDRSDVASLNAPARGAEDAAGMLELGETIQAPRATTSPRRSCSAPTGTAAVRAAIARLSDRERQVLCARARPGAARCGDRPHARRQRVARLPDPGGHPLQAEGPARRCTSGRGLD